MPITLCAIIIIAVSVLAFYYAHKAGYKSAESNFLKEKIKNEAKEKQRANKIIDNVRRMSDSDISNRLQDITTNK